MKVVLTAQSLKHLEKSLRFFVEVLQIPKPQVVKIKNRLFESARSLSSNPYKGQYEPYLGKLKQGTED